MAVTGGRAVVGLKFLSAGKPLEFPPEDRTRLAELRGLYPERASAVLPGLWLAQKRFGYISQEAVAAVARELEVPESEVAGAASFYTMFHLEPVGRYVIQVCCTLSCSLLGADALLEHLKRKLGIGVGETTPDGRFTLKKVECLAACGSGPMLQINEEKFHENLDLEAVDRLIDSLQ
jgi:NADH-quinone oxidoreductase subunit E